MSVATRAPRWIALAALLALVAVLVPVRPVLAEERPPEVVSETVDLGDHTPDEGSAPPARDDEGPSAAAVPDADGQDEGGEDVGQEDAGDAIQRSEVLEAPLRFSGLGLRGQGDPSAVHVRAYEPDEGWSAWLEVEVMDASDGPDEDTDEAAAAPATQGWASEAIWTGEATHVQLEVTGAPLSTVQATFIDAMGHSEGTFERLARQLTPRMSSPAAEASAQPDVIRRDEWGADEESSWRDGRSPSYAEVDFGVLHHTATSNWYSEAEAAAQVRNIQHWHVHGNGWQDIGYNFLIDRFGNVYEGRAGGMELGVVGAHAGGWNTGSFGVAIMGNFNDAAPPQAARDAAARVIAWKYDVHGIDSDPGGVTAANEHRIRSLEGHRNVRRTSSGSPIYTAESTSDSFRRDCPGELLYDHMDDIRAQAHAYSTAASAAVPVSGDWNGDGRDTPGWFVEGVWRLRNSNSAGGADHVVEYGQAGDVPVVGDFNGDGRSSLGVIRDGDWMLRFDRAGGAPQREFRFGRVTDGDRPLVGDWNGDGRDTIGIVRDGTWHLRDDLAGGVSDRSFVYGRVTQGDVPLIGDWNGDGRDTIGIVREGTWHLRHSLTGGYSDHQFVYGRVLGGDIPLMSDWNRDGRDTPGIVRGSTWHLRFHNQGGYSDASFDVDPLS